MANQLVLDVSTFNPIANYIAASKQIQGVIIRVGYRGYGTGTLVKDSLFDTHVSNFSKLCPIGFYFMSTAMNATEGAQEAAYVYSLIKDYKTSFPVFIDSEYSNNAHNGRSDYLSQAARTEAVVGFCEKIEKLGYTAGIYASDSWFINQLNYNVIKKYKLWVASYGKAPSRVPQSDQIGWQYTSGGNISGINGRVDLSYWYDSIGGIGNIQNIINTNSNPYVEPTTLLRKGSKGEGVYWLQYELNEEKYGLAVDGDFGINTERSVIDYQYRHGLEIDGVVGSITRKALRDNMPQVPNPVLPGVQDTRASFATGVEVNLVEVPLYGGSSAIKEVRKLSGKYFIWSASLINNRVRITNKYENVGKVGQVTGWVNYTDISTQFK